MARRRRGERRNRGTATVSTNSDEAPVISEKDLAEHDLAPQGEAMDGRKPGASAEKSVIDILRTGS